MPVSFLVRVLEQPAFLGRELVRAVQSQASWIATQETTGIATVHGMVFGQSMRLCHCRGIWRHVMCLGYLDLPCHRGLVFESSATVLESGQWITHHPPRLAPLRNGGPLGPPLVLGCLPLTCTALASGCSAACFLAMASLMVSKYDLGLSMQIFNSLVLSHAVLR